MLALERTATMRTNENGSLTEVKVKPFGGGVRLLKPEVLKKYIGEFNYDSHRSREEGDFRIQINPLHWEKVREICNEHLAGRGEGIFDFSPVRELKEELWDSLHVLVPPDAYRLQSRGMVVEDVVSTTNNVNAQGRPTMRIYFIFDALLEDPGIISMLTDNSRNYSDMDLQRMANEDAMKGGKGRANAVLAVEPEELRSYYRSISSDDHETDPLFAGHRLDGNVPAILHDFADL
jgi:hypothetical protein